MFCKNCGKDIAEEMRFCTGCGAPVAVPVQQQTAQYVPQQQVPKQKLLFVTFILGICWLVYIIIGIVMSLRVTPDGSTQSGLPSLPPIISLLPIVMSVIAIRFNYLGWKNNDAKKTLIAAIIYIFSLFLPSVILCFIGFNKLKKNA